MGRGAGPGRCVTLHTGRAGRRLRPVLVEMLGERQGTASGHSTSTPTWHQHTQGGTPPSSHPASGEAA